jgi:hypothetical protein
MFVFALGNHRGESAAQQLLPPGRHALGELLRLRCALRGLLRRRQRFLLRRLARFFGFSLAPGIYPVLTLRKNFSKDYLKRNLIFLSTVMEDIFMSQKLRIKESKELGLRIFLKYIYREAMEANWC